jgi:hypothetical protein
MTGYAQYHPFQALSLEFSDAIAQTRQDLRDFSQIRSDFIEGGLAAIDAAKAHLSEPSGGEIFSHMLAAGLKLSDRDRRMVAAAWLALFGYVRLVDDALDKKGYLDSRTTIISSALMGWGIATMARYTAGTKYHDAFLDNVNRAFSGQFQDIMDRGDLSANRTLSDQEKNRVFVAVAAGFSAAAHDSDDRLLRAVEVSVAAFQTLDDLRDVQEDHHDNNLTAFVRIARECVDSAASLTHTAIYLPLIRDPRTVDALKRAGATLDQSLMLLDGARDLAMITYFRGMRDSNTALIGALEEYQRAPSPAQETELMRRIAQLSGPTG